MVTIVLLVLFITPKVMAATNFVPERPNFIEKKLPTYTIFNSIADQK